jgi:hypothetical protein
MSKTRYKKETKRRSLFDSLRAITPDKLQYWPPKLAQAFLATSKTPIPIFSFNGSLQKKILAIKSKSAVRARVGTVVLQTRERVNENSRSFQHYFNIPTEVL